MATTRSSSECPTELERHARERATQLVGQCAIAASRRSTAARTHSPPRNSRRPRVDTLSVAEHDALFKRAFSSPEHVAGELCSVLPPSVTSALDLERLELVAGSFVDPALADRHTDLLFRVPLRAGAGEHPRSGRPGDRSSTADDDDDERAYVYLLFEHQSTPGPLMAFRMLGYVVEIWRRSLRESPGARLPLVIPLVLHHGPSGWTAARRLHALVHGLDRLPELAGFVPSFELLIDDLASLDDAARIRRPLAPLPLLALWLLRDGRDPQALLGHLAAFALALEQLADCPRDDVASVLR